MPEIFEEVSQCINFYLNNFFYEKNKETVLSKIESKLFYKNEFFYYFLETTQLQDSIKILSSHISVILFLLNAPNISSRNLFSSLSELNFQTTMEAFKNLAKFQKYLLFLSYIF